MCYGTFQEETVIFREQAWILCKMLLQSGIPQLFLDKCASDNKSQQFAFNSLNAIWHSNKSFLNKSQEANWNNLLKANSGTVKNLLSYTEPQPVP